MTGPSEPTMIGLSDEMHGVLKRLKEDGYFAEMVDAYRFGIAVALSHGVLPTEVPTPRTTVFSVATVDPDREIATAIRALIDVGDEPTYRWAERLADWGLRELDRLAVSGDIDFAVLLDSVARTAE